MAATTRTNYEKFMKELYRGSVVADLCNDENALFALLRKNPNTGGVKYVKPVKYSYGTGRSATYTNANANVGAPQRKRWEMDWTNHYVKAAVENKALELAAGAGRDGSFKDLLVDEADSAYAGFAKDVEIEFHEDGTGRRGTSTGAISGTTISLQAGQGVNFNVGDVLQKYDASGATLPAETKTVVTVDRDQDKFTVASDWAVPTAVDDYFLLQGDSSKAYGLKAWLPASDGIVAGGGTAPNTLNAIDRSVDPGRLAGVKGVKGTLSGLLITDALVQTCAKVLKNGGRPNIALVSPEDFADLALETEARGRYTKVDASTGSISFSALEVMTGAGAISVVGDLHTQSDQAFILDTRKIEVYSTNALPSAFKKDGSFYHRTETADEISFYLYGFYGLSIQEPGRCSWIRDLY